MGFVGRWSLVVSSLVVGSWVRGFAGSWLRQFVVQWLVAPAR